MNDECVSINFVVVGAVANNGRMEQFFCVFMVYIQYVNERVGGVADRKRSLKNPLPY